MDTFSKRALAWRVAKDRFDNLTISMKLLNTSIRMNNKYLVAQDLRYIESNIADIRRVLGIEE